MDKKEEEEYKREIRKLSQDNKRLRKELSEALNYNHKFDKYKDSKTEVIND